MKIGTVVEFIDRQKIICAVVVELKGDRLHLITEGNREINLSPKRLFHASHGLLDASAGRDKLVDALKEIAARRNTLMEEIDVRELWEVLNPEQDWIELSTLTGLCFPDFHEDDHEAAVIRALFGQRLYFKFDHGRFFPHSQEKVQQMLVEAEEAERRQHTIESGRRWLKSLMEKPRAQLGEEDSFWVELLKAHYLLEKESPTHDLARAVLADTGIDTPDKVFRLLVKAGVWSPDENFDLIRLEIATRFSPEIDASADSLVQERKFVVFHPSPGIRRDLTHLEILTIDGQATLDFDDALSIENLNGRMRLGIHIADVGEVIRKESPLDLEARSRGSSIYLPDQRIPMMPPGLSEDLCSLRSGEVRPAISMLAELDAGGEMLSKEIFPSVIRVKDQLTYQEANLRSGEDPRLQALVDTARLYRRKRLAQGALQITLPEIHVRLDETGGVNLTRINRESPSRLAVAEIMIMANWMMASFLKEKGIPAVFRSQPQPKERLYGEDGGTLFQNWMQRKLLSRFVLDTEPENHSGLGLDAYVTGTSPIRKYYDLLTQRQIRSAFGLEPPYSQAEMEEIITALEPVMVNVAAVQARRHRYWLLKYLEKRVGTKEEAIFLGKAKNAFQVLIPEYMLECRVPSSGGTALKPEDVIQVTIQHVSARNDVLNVFMG